MPINKGQLLRNLLVYLFFAIVIFFFIFVFQTPIVSNDSGVYLYIGNTIVHGQVPYAAGWDHKPPLIYFINALGLLFTPHSVIGVRIIELILLIVVTSLVFNLLYKRSGLWIASLCITSYLCALLPTLNGGNTPEEFFLLPQLASLLLFVRFERKSSPSWNYLLIGILWGISILLKEALIGIFIALLAYLLLNALADKKYKLNLRRGLFIFLGLAIPIVATILYFFSVGHLKDLYDAFVFNFYYSEIDLGGHFINLAGGVFFTMGVFIAAVIGWFIGFKKIISTKRSTSPRVAQRDDTKQAK